MEPVDRDTAVTVLDEWDGGMGWLAYPDESMRRASHAIVDDEAVWLVDPVDAAGLDSTLGSLGDVAGVLVLLDRHKRDAAAIARRHDVPVWIPDFFDGVASELDVPVRRVSDEVESTGFGLHRVIDNRWWQEAALSTGEGTLVVPEAVGTVPFFLAPGERLGVHPGLRPWPPKHLASLDPERVLVGHGTGILDDAAPALTDAISHARRRAPRAYFRALRLLVGR